MRIAIIGAGAMGCLLGHGLCGSGHEVALFDVPEKVTRLRVRGELNLIRQDGSCAAPARPALITSGYAGAGVQDLVILATKAHDLPAVAEGVAQLIDAHSCVMTIQNGIPWWYLDGLATGFDTAHIDCLDPHGTLRRAIPTQQIVGCVAYPAALLEPDGTVRHIEGNAFPVGEAMGAPRERTQAIARALNEAGFKCRVLEDIRSEIWLKAWGALSINPISALTRATMEAICTHQGTRALVAQMMHEAQQVAEALGANFRHTIEKRIEGARLVGAHRTSMLQDLENGLPLELDALMLAVLELARVTGRETPTIRAIYACTALLDSNQRGLLA